MFSSLADKYKTDTLRLVLEAMWKKREPGSVLSSLRAILYLLITLTSLRLVFFQIIKATHFTEAFTVMLLLSGCWYILPRCRINRLKNSFVPVVGLSNEHTQYHDSVLLLWCCFYCDEVVIAWCCMYGSVIMCSSADCTTNCPAGTVKIPWTMNHSCEGGGFQSKRLIFYLFFFYVTFLCILRLQLSSGSAMQKSM